MRRTTAALVLVAAIALAFLDRPLAEYLNRTFASPALFQGAEVFFTVLLVAGGVIFALALGLGWLALRRRPLRPWMATTLASTTAGVAALALSEGLKFVIGRSPAYPTFLVDGVYRFAPFHWGSFPSSTAASATAMLTVLWIGWPRGRPAYTLLLAIICAFILVVNAHWLSDVLGGILLGGITARARIDRFAFEPKSQTISSFTH